MDRLIEVVGEFFGEPQVQRGLPIACIVFWAVYGGYKTVRRLGRRQLSPEQQELVKHLDRRLEVTSMWKTGGDKNGWPSIMYVPTSSCVGRDKLPVQISWHLSNYKLYLSSQDVTSSLPWSDVKRIVRRAKKVQAEVEQMAARKRLADLMSAQA